MSYQALARTYRPKTFAGMVGQQHVLTALANSLSQQRIHHAYLFTGTRGVGKTTVARILAKSLLCENGISSHPCGTCSTCLAIDAGHYMDLIEIDAASRTKVEDTRELLDNVQYAPSQGRYKIYIIDEVHMLSGHSFNALLKTLEEPPEHVKFLLATTDPQKLPVTVLSRCLQFNLKNMLPDQIVEHLATVLTKQTIPYEKPALWHIAKAARGSMRDALSILDQAIAYSDLHLKDSAVQQMLGTVSHERLLKLLQALSVRDAKMLLQLSDEMASVVCDFEHVLSELIDLLQQIAILQVLPDAHIEDPNLQAALLELSEQLTKEDTQLFYQIALLARRDLPQAPNPKRGFDMTLLRMLTFQPVSEKKNSDGLTAPVFALENSVATTTAATPRILKPEVKTKTKISPPQDEVMDFFSEPEVSVTTPIIQENVIDTQEPILPNAISPIQSNDDWYRVVQSLPLQGVSKALAYACQWQATDGTSLKFICSPNQAALANPNSEARLLIALNQTLDLTHQIHIEQQTTTDTPSDRQMQEHKTAILDATETLKQAPITGLLKKHLDADLVDVALV